MACEARVAPEMNEVFKLHLASMDELPFARDLTCRNMLRYYIQHELLWQDEAFDVAWSGRENWLIVDAQVRVGFISLSRDARTLYIRELQMTEACRGQGAGSWAIDQIAIMARKQRHPALRLTVFNNNPARRLYERKGFRVQGEDACFLRMELDLSTRVL